MKADIKLSEFELVVMNILWQTDKASSPEVHEKIKLDKTCVTQQLKSLSTDSSKKKRLLGQTNKAALFIMPQRLSMNLSPLLYSKVF